MNKEKIIKILNEIKRDVELDRLKTLDEVRHEISYWEFANKTLK